MKQYFLVDEDTGLREYTFPRDGRGRFSKKSLLFLPEVQMKLKHWTRQELKTLTCDRAREYINSKILKEKDGNGEYVLTDTQLKECKIDHEKREISTSTAHGWITHPIIGCYRKYKTQSYYVDNHESQQEGAET